MAIDFSKLELKCHKPTLEENFAEDTAKALYNLSEEQLISLQECMAANGLSIGSIIEKGIHMVNTELFHQICPNEEGEL